MKYFISYKYSWEDLVILRKNLEYISSTLEKNWDETFIFYRDVEDWWDKDVEVNEVLPIAYTEMDKCDAVFVFVNNEDKSEWMLLECGYAKAKNKKIILFIKKDLKYSLLRSLASDIIEFEDIKNLENKI